MNTKVSTCIVIVAFARPNLLKKILNQIDSRENLNVLISVDGATSKLPNNTIEANNECKKIAREWVKSTSHNARFIFLKENLGCNAHTLSAMKSSLKYYDQGILLEDDCQFRIEYIDFILNNEEILQDPKYLSASGWHVNWNRDLLKKPTNEVIEFQISPFMGASMGLVFNVRSIEIFEKSLNEYNLELWHNQIKKFTKSLPVNFLQKQAIEFFWNEKLVSCLRTWNKELPTYNKHLENGWDARWQLAGILNEKKFLLPNWILARASQDQDGISWHTQKIAKNYVDWSNLNLFVKIKPLDFGTIKTLNDFREITGLGISHYPIKIVIVKLATKLIQKNAFKRIINSKNRIKVN